MTRDSSFKKVVRRHAEETGQRYTEALTDLEGLEARMFHQPVADRLLASSLLFRHLFPAPESLYGLRTILMQSSCLSLKIL